jgi:hypothetical protein
MRMHSDTQSDAEFPIFRLKPKTVLFTRSSQLWVQVMRCIRCQEREIVTNKSPSSKTVDAVVQGDVKSFLKSEGFKKSGRTFHRQNGEMLQVVNFQTTWLNTPDEAQFTINLNVVLPFYHEKWTGQQVPKNPGSAAAICSRRLGHILPEGTDRWWTVTPSTDCAAVSREVAELICAVGLPYLEKAANLQYLCEKLGSGKHFPGMLMSQPLAFAILLCHLGREEEAIRVIDETRRKNRAEGFGKTIDLIHERLGLESNKCVEQTA